MQRRSLTQRGFTLLELLVVLVVLGLLAGIVAPKYFSQLGRSEVKVARAQIEGLSKALDLYRLEVGHYPNSEQGLQALAQGGRAVGLAGAQALGAGGRLVLGIARFALIRIAAPRESKPA